MRGPPLELLPLVHRRRPPVLGDAGLPDFRLEWVGLG